MRDILNNRTVGDLRTLIVAEPAIITPDESIDNLMEKLISDPRSRHVYVVDSENVLIGSVRLNAVVQYLFPHETVWHTMSLHGYHEQFSKEKVRDIMNDDPKYVKDATTVSEMAQVMMAEMVNELPVVDVEMHVIGEVNMLEAITFYTRALREDKSGIARK